MNKTRRVDMEMFIAIVKENQRLIYKLCYTYCKNSGSRKDLGQEILIHCNIFPPAALTSKTLYNVDVFVDVSLFVWKFAVALGVAYLLVFLIHKHLYNKRFREVEKIIDRLREFEKDS